MNDFTKEELSYLYDELDSNYSELKNIPLMDKVKSMIHNYCEHEWTHTYREREVSLCSKCDKEHYED